jgi:TIR domain
MAGKIFVSYTRSDNATVAPYVEAFRAEGLDHWIDREEIEPGSDFIERINEGLRTCPNAIIFYSASYAGNEFTRREMSELTRANLTLGGRNLVVVRVDETPLPPLLAPLSWVWAGKPEDLARVFSGRLAGEAHRASLAVGLSRPDAPPIPVFLDRLAAPSVEQLARDCRDHLDRAGLLDRRTRFPATVNLVELSFGVRANPSEIVVDDMRSELNIAENHRFFINHFRQEITAMGVALVAPAFLLALRKRIQELDVSRSGLRDSLKALLVDVA